MDTRLPKLVNPGRLSARRESLSGELPAAEISRLGTLYDISTAVDVSLSFSPNGFGRTAVTGELKALLQARCQRCLNEFSMPISHLIDLKLIDLDQVAGRGSQAIEAKEDDIVEYRSKMDIYELIEDELVLATPIIPRHEQNDCVAPNEQTTHDSDFGAKQATVTGIDGKMHGDAAHTGEELNERNRTRETTRPFADLAKLLSSDE